jgi:DNA-binding response OmpR family regulator
MKLRKRILVVEDDAALAKGLQDNLVSEGFDALCVSDGSRAQAAVADFTPDLIVLDLMLPGVSGFELCRAIRDAGETPILVLTARSQKADKIRCLDHGADDYLTKPFDLEELLARIRAILRRTRPNLEMLTMGAVTIDFKSRLALRGGADLHLTHKEFEILHYLAEREGHVVHREELLKELWGYAQTPFTRSVDTAMARLRKKIESDAHRPRFIHTVHGDGYCLTPNGQAL